MKSLRKIRDRFLGLLFRSPWRVMLVYGAVVLLFLYLTMWRPELRKPFCERSWNRDEVRCVQYWMRHPHPLPE